MLAFQCVGKHGIFYIPRALREEWYTTHSSLHDIVNRTIHHFLFTWTPYLAEAAEDIHTELPGHCACLALIEDDIVDIICPIRSTRRDRYPVVLTCPRLGRVQFTRDLGLL